MPASQDIEYTFQIRKEGDQFVAHAMPLDVLSSGKTSDEARKALDEAVHLFLVTAVDMGTLEEILQAGQKILKLGAFRIQPGRAAGVKK
jgi:predicted RNase H-like HicB family nuclease